MREIKTELRQWGNSLGLIIPKDIAKRERLKPRQSVTVLLVKKNNVLKETFGTMKNWKINTQKALDELETYVQGADENQKAEIQDKVSRFREGFLVTELDPELEIVKKEIEYWKDLFSAE